MLALQHPAPRPFSPTIRAPSLHARPRSALAALLSLLVACGDSSAESATEATHGSSSAADDDTASATGPDTHGPPDPDTDADVPTTGAPNDGTTGGADTDDTDDTDDADDGGESDGTTTAAEEPGPVDPDIVSGCRGYCDRWTECGLQPDLGACVDGCAQAIGVVEGACKAAQLGHLSCETALSCELLLDAVGDGGPCAAEAEAAASACQGEAPCGGSHVAGGDVCSLSVECGDDPVREIECDADSCRCLEGGEEVGACAADGACADPDGLDAKLAACCGF